MQAATLTAVVVLPTPPFWFAIAYVVPMGLGDASDRVGRNRPVGGSPPKEPHLPVETPSGRLRAIPARRGYPFGVGPTFWLTQRDGSPASLNGSTGTAIGTLIPRMAAAAAALASSARSTRAFQATS